MALEPKLQPIGVQHDLTAEGDEKNEKDEAAANPRARTSPAKSKTPLQPIEKHIQHQQF